MSKYLKIIKNDTANGEGICVSYWVSGCEHHCKGCHNPETWDRNQGIDFCEDTIQEVLTALRSHGIKRNLSFTGGDPLASYNLHQIKTLSSRVRKEYPEITMFLWTGYTLEQLTSKQLDAIKEIDVLIDGKFEESLKDLTLRFKGSTNQRVINMSIFRNTGKVETLDIKE